MDSGYILGLDIGDARIGLAIASPIAKLPQPIETIPNDGTAVPTLRAIIEREGITQLVVGVPRNLEGQETAQSEKIRLQTESLAAEIGLEPVFVDESLSSKRADEYQQKQKKNLHDQDSIAACFILDEYFVSIGSKGQ
jgi:putative holliday junction resolvase